MATRIVTELHDDIDGSDATETILFSIDGTSYEIDLSERNANRLRNTVAEFVDHARKVSGRRDRKSAASGRVDKTQSGAMRQWLKEHGYEVLDRGRIPDWLQQAYHDRH